MSVFRIPVSVRTYELDMLGHVNNAVYLNWLEQGRLAAMEASGYAVRSLRQDWLTNIVRIEIDWRRATHYGDELVVETELVSVGKSSFRLRGDVIRLPDREVVAESIAVLVWLDEDGRPASLPSDFEDRWRKGAARA